MTVCVCDGIFDPSKNASIAVGCSSYMRFNDVEHRIALDRTTVIVFRIMLPAALDSCAVFLHRASSEYFAGCAAAVRLAQRAAFGQIA